MSITRKQLNDWALIVDSAARDEAIAGTMNQALGWYGQTPAYAATFYSVYQCLSPDTTRHYSWEDLMGSPMARRGA